MRKILFIVYYFPPMGMSGVQRPLKFAKFLPKFGWEPIILTSSDNEYYAFDESLEKELEEMNLTIYRTPSKSKTQKRKKFPNYKFQLIAQYIMSFFKIPDSKSSWRNPAMKLAEKILKEHDISAIYSTAPPFTNFLIGRDLSKKYKIPLFIDYRDSWIDNKFHHFPTFYHKSRNEKLESSVINESKKIYVVSRYSKELLLKRYKILAHDDITILPHGYDKSDFEVENDLIADKSKFTIVHLGSFLDDRNPKPFFKVVKSLIKSNKDLAAELKILIIGVARKSHINLVRKYKLEKNIEFIDYVPHKQAVNYLKIADVLWILLNDDIRTPGKLYEYFGSKKPILFMGPDGNMKELAKKTKASLSANPNDKHQIQESLLTFYKLWKEGMLPEADLEFTQQFDREKLTEDLAISINKSIKISQ